MFYTTFLDQSCTYFSYKSQITLAVGKHPEVYNRNRNPLFAANKYHLMSLLSYNKIPIHSSQGLTEEMKSLVQLFTTHKCVYYLWGRSQADSTDPYIIQACRLFSFYFFRFWDISDFLLPSQHNGILCCSEHLNIQFKRTVMNLSL